MWPAALKPSVPGGISSSCSIMPALYGATAVTSYLGLQQLEIRVIDEEPAAPPPGDLAQDSGALEPPERRVDGRHAQPEAPRGVARGEHDALPGELVDPQC